MTRNFRHSLHYILGIIFLVGNLLMNKNAHKNLGGFGVFLPNVTSYNLYDMDDNITVLYNEDHQGTIRVNSRPN